MKNLLYRDVCAHFVLDERDAVYRWQLEEMGYDVRLLRTDALTFERQVDIARNLIQLMIKTDLSPLSPYALNEDTTRLQPLV